MANNDDLKLIESMHLVFSDMQKSVTDEVDAIREQTHQVSSLLEDAIASLHEAFGAIHKSSEQQITTMSSLMSQVVGGTNEANIFQKAERASETLRKLVDTLLLSSKNNLYALTAMDVTKQQITKISILSKEQNNIADQLLACCASNSPDIVIIAKLAEQLKQREQKQSQYIEETVVNFMETHQLIDSIASKDIGEVFASKTKVEEILNHFFQINDVISQNRSSVSLVNANIRKHLGAAIRALQFEDISRQSLGHTVRHLDRMKGMMDILTNGLDALNKKDMDMTEYVVCATAIHTAMLSYHQSLQLEDTNPVSQESMDEGGIDLF